MSKKLNVNYENKPCYNIYLEDSFESLAVLLNDELTKHYDNVCIVTDSNVAPLYLDSVKTIFYKVYENVDSFIFDAGEENKNLDSIEMLYEHLITSKYTRNSLLVALGGGVVGDMTGFAASTFLRGIDFIQLPTTLLSQVDSSIGGKTGVDFNKYKNMIGAFYMPKLVYMNLKTLNTLDDYNFACGMGEVIKSALIQNKDFFYWLKENSKSINSKCFNYLENMIFECCKIKGQVVEIDPKEQGIRSYLNFGHTLGHSIEKLSNFTMGHGQCVAVGMVCASYLSLKLGFINEEDYREIKNVITLFNLPIDINNSYDANEIVKVSKSDKKMIGAKIKFVILKNIGEADCYLDFENSDLLEAVNEVIR